jgi:trehalose/maltose hydrolase-like predicted phosphorylase
VALRLGREELVPSDLGQLRWSWNWTSDPRQVVSFERIVSFARDDGGYARAGAAARDALSRARQAGPSGVLAAHEGAWADRWHCSDVEVDGDPVAQRALRFASYHLNSAANPDDERASIGARALTGDCYWATCSGTPRFSCCHSTP